MKNRLVPLRDTGGLSESCCIHEWCYFEHMGATYKMPDTKITLTSYPFLQSAHDAGCLKVRGRSSSEPLSKAVRKRLVLTRITPRVGGSHPKGGDVYLSCYSHGLSK